MQQLYLCQFDRSFEPLDRVQFSPTLVLSTVFRARLITFVHDEITTVDLLQDLCIHQFQL